MISLDELKNLKTSFISAIDLLKEQTKVMQGKFNTLENETNNLIKSYDVVINRCQNIISNNNLNLKKALNEYTDAQLEEELSDTKFDQKSELIAAVKKLKKREIEITNKQNEIYDLIKELSHYTTKEKDSSQELIMDTPAENDIIDKVDSILDIEEDDFLSNLSDYDKEIIPEKVEEDVMVYNVEDGVSLVDIVTSVYKNAGYWSNLYEYGNNKDLIDERIHFEDIEEYIYDKNILSGLSIEIPKTLTVYEQKKL